MKYEKRAILLIGCVIVFKIILSAFLQLSNDEVYYITYARELKFNYFDHPPLVGLILKFFSFNLNLTDEIFLRLGFIVCGAVSSWLMYLIGKKIHNELAGWIALLLFTASIYGNVISGMMIMPDAPMLLFWLWAVYLAVSIIKDRKYRQLNEKMLVLFGVAAGLAIMSKVSAAMLWGGFISYALFFDRYLFKFKSLYIAVLASVIIASPILYDLLITHSAGFNYHANRVAFDARAPFRPDSFLRQFLGEAGYNNPVNYILSIWGLIYCLRKKIINSRISSLLLCIALPLIFVVWLFSLFRDTLPHWTGPSYVTLIFFAAIFLTDVKLSVKKVPSIVLWANGIVVLALIIIAWAVYFLPFTYNAKDLQRTGKGDLLLDFSGWKEFNKDFKNIYDADAKHNRMKKNAFLITDYWFPAAHIDWYVATPHQYPFLAVGSLQDIHQYAWLNKSRRQLIAGDDAYYLQVSNYYKPPDSTLMSYFNRADTVQAVPQLRAGKLVRYFFVTRLYNYKGGIDSTGIIK